MNGVRKKFDKKLHAENDAIAKEKAIAYFLKHHGHELTIHENPDQYGRDLVVVMNGEVIFIEVEIKKVWKWDHFPWDSIQFPERKKKFANSEHRTIFFMLNLPKTRALMIADEDLLSSPLVEIPNKEISRGEYFFQVPIAKATLVELE